MIRCCSGVLTLALLGLACGCNRQARLPDGLAPARLAAAVAAPDVLTAVPSPADPARLVLWSALPSAGDVLVLDGAPALTTVADLGGPSSLGELLAAQSRRRKSSGQRGRIYGMVGYQYSNEQGSLDELGGGHGFNFTTGYLWPRSASMALGFEGSFCYGMFSSDTWGDATLNRILFGLRIFNLQSGYFFNLGGSYNMLEFNPELTAGMNSKGFGGYAGFGYMHTLTPNGRWYVIADTNFHMWDSNSSVAGGGMTMTIVAGVSMALIF